MNFHQNLQDITEDQLSLASIHYMRSHYQEAIDIYKRILLDNRSVSFYASQNLIWLVSSVTSLAKDLGSFRSSITMCSNLLANLVSVRTLYCLDHGFSTFISLSPFQGAFLDLFPR